MLHLRVRMEAGRVGEGQKTPKNLPKKRKSEDAVWRLPLVGDDHLRTGQQKKTLTGDGPLMEAATVRERLCEGPNRGHR
jgi:hypothetical protein